MRSKRDICLFLSILLSLCLPALAKVQVKERSQFSLGGAMGKVVGMFGGKAAKEGIIQTVSVDGNRKITVVDQKAELIDLDREVLYEIDLKKKSYKVTTFDEMRQRFEEMTQKMASSSGDQDQETDSEKEFEMDFDLKETGQNRNINGFDCREIQMVVTIREKGKTLEEAGGTVLTSNMWMTDGAEAVAEIQDFDRRYAEKLYGSAMSPESAAQLATVMSMYPGLKDAMSRMQSEEVNMSGTAIQTTVKYESVMSKKQMQEGAQAEEEEEKPSGFGGLLGGLSKKLSKKDDSSESKTPGRSTVMTSTNEILAATTDFPAETLSIPAGFKEKK